MNEEIVPMTYPAYTVYTYPSVSTCGQSVVIDPDVCNGCNRCVEVCQMDCFAPNQEKGKPPYLLYPDECWRCGVCVAECPLADKGAIRYQWPLAYRFRWKRKDTGEHFRLGMANPPDPCTTPPVSGW